MIVVLASGTGTNFLAIAKEFPNVVLISDNPSSGAVKKAIERRIPTFVIRYESKKDNTLISLLKSLSPDVIALAGFSKILGGKVVKEFYPKILNIHPSILPAFPGTTKAQKKAVEYGVRFSGCTVHIVSEEVDLGPVIIQGIVPIFPWDTEDTARERILKVEHKIYPMAIKLFLEGKVKVEGRKVFVDGVNWVDENFHIINPYQEV